MKKIVLTIIVAAFYLTICAQKPIWLRKMPSPDNGTYIYIRGKGIANTEMAAQQLALADAMNQGAHLRGQIFDSEEINKALQNGTDYTIVSHRYKIPLNKVDEYTEATSNVYRVFVLCQVAKAGYDELSVLWSNCSICEVIDDIDERKTNRDALLKSLWPGGGHIYKNHKALGYTIMVSDIALVCGGIGCYFAAQTYSDIMDDPTATASEKRDAESTYNMLNSASIVCYSAAAVLYIVNLWTAYTISDNRNTRVSFHPVISPNNKDIAFGIGASFKF